MSLECSDSSAREEYQLPSKDEEEEKIELSEKEELDLTKEEEEFKMVMIAKDGERRRGLGWSLGGGMKYCDQSSKPCVVVKDRIPEHYCTHDCTKNRKIF